MHELAITQGVVDMVSDRMEGRITAVRLEIGRLSGVLPGAVRFCFDVCCAGTRLEGARLDIVEPTASARCQRCAAEFEPASVLALCPCGSADVTVLAGRELRVTGVDVASA